MADKRGKRGFPVGMRVVKTAIAVFICGIIGALRGIVPSGAMCVAVICMQNSTEKTVTSGLHRLLGTAIGGILGVAAVFFCMGRWVAENTYIYYLILALALVPIILVTLLIKRPSITALSCVVFLSIAASQMTDSPVSGALERLSDTLIGVVITIGIDLLLPYHTRPEEEDNGLPGPDGELVPSGGDAPVPEPVAVSGDAAEPVAVSGDAAEPAAMTEAERYMDAAAALARQAMAEGEVPVGCVIVRHGEIIARGRNLREQQHDATAHAEMLAIQAACERLGDWRLGDCDLYVTLEPCPMCAGAIINARVRRVFYGARDNFTGACVSRVCLFEEHDTHRPAVYGGVLEPVCRALMQDFFAALRSGEAPSERECGG